MNRDVLTQILSAAPGIDGKDALFKTQEGHRISFYLGDEGRGMVVNEVTQVEVTDVFVRLTTEEKGEIFVPVEGVHAIAARPIKAGQPKRTGFA